jgi:hypothetical protein
MDELLKQRIAALQTMTKLPVGSNQATTVALGFVALVQAVIYIGDVLRVALIENKDKEN